MVDPRTANRRHTRYCMLTVCVRPPGAQSPEARRDSGADVPRERLGRAAAGPAPGARRAPARRGRRMPYGIAAWPVARGAGGSAGAVGCGSPLATLIDTLSPNGRWCGAFAARPGPVAVVLRGERRSLQPRAARAIRNVSRPRVDRS